MPQQSQSSASGNVEYNVAKRVPTPDPALRSNPSTVEPKTKTTYEKDQESRNRRKLSTSGPSRVPSPETSRWHKGSTLEPEANTTYDKSQESRTSSRLWSKTHKKGKGKKK
ncbi:hypothetical protein BKA67DRAFT_542674 [Truncatella angustata]|uniref:Uncharacterized protein n=1 Tax=Truncatella angustata TaxID=152316 RepID=A0A9P8RHQ0_9PEZI|nr:uncharacterized protein BKA67DRAFT_542674 [Truncatella angustata]KAH6638568.1 hypothetical protein BKA67DRAFT_542674 [Truncatella angustata]KAH8194253.1 hypothetical protein TruAng_011574 [Truncatella angustata]